MVSHFLISFTHDPYIHPSRPQQQVLQQPPPVVEEAWRLQRRHLMLIGAYIHSVCAREARSVMRAGRSMCPGGQVGDEIERAGVVCAREARSMMRAGRSMCHGGQVGR